MKYRLKKDLPTFKAGDEFELSDNGNLYLLGHRSETRVCAYAKDTLNKFPNIIKDWFEEIPEKPKTVWDLKKGDIHYYITSDNSILYATWDDDVIDRTQRSFGDVFLTAEDAEKELAWRKARQILLRDAKGFKPDWKNLEQEKYRVAYNATSGKLLANWQLDVVHSCIHFATREDAEVSIKAHEKEWKIYLGVEG